MDTENGSPSLESEVDKASNVKDSNDATSTSKVGSDKMMSKVKHAADSTKEKMNKLVAGSSKRKEKFTTENEAPSTSKIDGEKKHSRVSEEFSKKFSGVKTLKAKMKKKSSFGDEATESDEKPESELSKKKFSGIKQLKEKMTMKKSFTDESSVSDELEKPHSEKSESELPKKFSGIKHLKAKVTKKTSFADENATASDELRVSPEKSDDSELSAKFAGMKKLKEKMTKKKSLTDEVSESEELEKPRVQFDTDKNESEIFEASDNAPLEEEIASTRESQMSRVSSTDSNDEAIRVGKVASFLLRDSTIIIGTSLLVAAIPSIVYWERVVSNQIPMVVSIAWMVAAFMVGRELERVHHESSEQAVPDLITVEPTKPSSPGAAPLLVKERSSSDLRPRERHSIAKTATRKLHWNLHFPEHSKTKQLWTNLKHSRRKKQHWERNMSASRSPSLLRSMYRDPTLRRKDIEAILTEEEKEQMEQKQEVGDEVKDSLGNFDLSLCTADTLADCVVKPLLKLRGMDVYLTGEEGAQDDIGTHPFLLENGLRNRKSWVVNIMLQWANVLIYFDLPEYIDDFENIVENDDDPDDVKALKRFLNGSDEYRNQRLKFLPAVVDASRIVKMLAPAKGEYTIASPILPVRWNKRHRSVTAKGEEDISNCSVMHPMVEVELDCMSCKAMRSMAAIVKRNLTSTVVDLAVLIQKPDGSIEDEPSACLGMWRFDRVDIEKCPMLPERVVSETEMVRRATALFSVSSADMASIAQAAEEVED